MSEPSRAARILRRTRNGVLLALGATLLLLGAERAGPRVMLALASAVLGAAAIELLRMGKLRGRLPDLALLAPVLTFALLQDASLRRLVDRSGWHARVAADPALVDWSWRPNPAAELGLALLVAWIAYGLWRSLVSLRLDRRGPRYALAALLLVLGAVVFRDDARVAYFVLVAAVPLCLVALSTLPVVLALRSSRRDLLLLLLLVAWLVPPLPWLARAAAHWGLGPIAALLVCSKIGDTAGYYVGNAFGRHHPFPRLSPGKTTEGCLGSLAAGTLGGAACVLVGLLPAEPYGLAGGSLAGALANLSAQAGDLLESWVKRRSGVKDSSTLFGSSGGILDQLDSLLVSVPVCLFLWPLFLALAPAAAG